jgi:LysR family transcriptional regulator, cys regulon transcriptional activator
MTLSQLRYFIAIVDAGFNITQAAQLVHATQPGLSKQLKQLEDELGFMLFIRKGRSLEALTEAGTQVLIHARQMQIQANSIRSLASSFRGDSLGQLIIATTHTHARFVLPPAIAEIRRKFADLSIHIQATSDTQEQALLERNDVDFALLSTAGELPGKGVPVPLFRWQRVVVVPKAHPLAAMRRLKLKQLSDFPLISYESAVSEASSLRQAFASQNLSPKFAMFAHDADLIKTYVRSGIGVGILAEMAISSLQDTDLVQLPAPVEIPECTAWAVLPFEKILRDHTALLLKTLAPHLDLRDVKRVLAGNQLSEWGISPTWIELSQAISC